MALGVITGPAVNRSSLECLLNVHQAAELVCKASHESHSSDVEHLG